MDASPVLGIVLSALLGTDGFDPSWQQIPKTFKGDDIVQIVSAFDTKKDEFESTSDYNMRIAKLAPSDGRIYTFVCEKNPFATEYDADKQEFTFSQPSYEISTIEVVAKTKSGDSYVGTNAFGATARVKDLSITRYAVSDQNWNSNRHISFRLSMPSAQARASKDDFGIALIGRLVPYRQAGLESPNERGYVNLGEHGRHGKLNNPYLWSSIDITQPTLDNPYETTTKQYVLFSNVEKVVVFRKSDRSVLLTVSLKDSGNDVRSQGVANPANVPTAMSVPPTFKEPRPAKKSWDAQMAQAWLSNCIKGVTIRYGSKRTPEQLKYACECILWNLEDRYTMGEMIDGARSNPKQIQDAVDDISAECKKNRPPELGPDPG